MKALILAAGYATRLYPVTKNQPKPLLEVSGKTILDYIVEKIERVDKINEIMIVTNDKFTSHFEQWSDVSTYEKKITVLNDGTTTNENRLGAIGDLQFSIKTLKIEDDLLVLAGDNLFDFELTDFVAYFDKVGTDCITTYHESNQDQLKRAGVIEINNNKKVLSFEEKPQNPISSYCVPAFYLYKKETLPLLEQYILEGNDPDAPGNFIPFLIQHKSVHSYFFEGNRYDIGTIESYETVQELFTEK